MAVFLEWKDSACQYRTGKRYYGKRETIGFDSSFFPRMSLNNLKN
jgi:hypothetical protein